MLKALKKQLSEEEEAFDLIKRKYSHLVKMSDENILMYCECHSKSELVQYVKELKIHIVQEESRDEKICICTDAKGDMKYLYMSKKEAELAQELRQREENITLNIYACPTSSGWHLTKE